MRAELSGLRPEFSNQAIGGGPRAGIGAAAGTCRRQVLGHGDELGQQRRTGADAEGSAGRWGIVLNRHRKRMLRSRGLGSLARRS